MTAKKGLFLTFEGGEGAGKTTQSRLLATSLEAAGYEVLLTREPGGTPRAEALRALLLQKDDEPFDTISECLLHYAARREHVEKKIKPALARGAIVISDRFADSTVAYQGYGSGLGTEWLAMLHSLTLGSFMPDLTFFLDIPVNSGMQRAANRNSALDRYESLGEDFHKQVYAGFSALAAAAPGRICTINASNSIATIHAEIIEKVQARLEKQILIQGC